MKQVTLILSAIFSMAMWSTATGQDSLKVIKAEDAINGIKYEFVWFAPVGDTVQIMITSGISGSGNYKTPTQSYSFVGTGAWQFVRDSVYDSTSISGLSIPSTICLSGWIKDSTAVWQVGNIQCANVLEFLQTTVSWVGQPTPDSVGNLIGYVQVQANEAGKLYWRTHTDSTKIWNKNFKVFADSMDIPRGKAKMYPISLGTVPSGGNGIYAAVLLETPMHGDSTEIIKTDIWQQHQPATADGTPVANKWNTIDISGNVVNYNEASKVWVNYRKQGSSTWFSSDTVYQNASTKVLQFSLSITNSIEEKTWYEIIIKAKNKTGSSQSVLQKVRTPEKPIVFELTVDTVLADAVNKKLKIRVSYSTPTGTATLGIQPKVDDDRNFQTLVASSSTSISSPANSGFTWIEVSVDTPACYNITVGGYTLDGTNAVTGWIDSVNVTYVCINSSTLRAFTVVMTEVKKDTLNKKETVSIKAVLTENTSASFSLTNNGKIVDQWSVVKDSDIVSKTIDLDTGVNVIVIAGSDSRLVDRYDTIIVYITPPKPDVLSAHSKYNSVIVDKTAKTVKFDMIYTLNKQYNFASTWITVAIKGTAVSGTHDIRTILASGTESYTKQIDTGVTFQIWANISNPSGLVGSDTIEVTITGGTVVVNGIAKFSEVDAYVYVNPQTGEITIKSDIPGQSQFTLYDMKGTVVTQQSFSGSLQTDLHNVPTGMYIYTVQTPYGAKVGKLVL